AVIGRLLCGLLTGRVLETNDVPWAGGWLTAGEPDSGLYVPSAGTRQSAAGIIVGEGQVIILYRR
ncbi:hypothetical protein, partial [Streptomyces sp. NPDC008122]|uniref:hypothetical protein n=1 Tax=Streptomyces sp. NPDC008122 TaxID=3364810 RepID=UPI0036EFBD5E